jgi:hypothetical protein
MPHSHGYRARTRSMFARKFGENGVNHLSTYLRNYKARADCLLACLLALWVWLCRCKGCCGRRRW